MDQGLRSLCSVFFALVVGSVVSVDPLVSLVAAAPSGVACFGALTLFDDRIGSRTVDTVSFELLYTFSLFSAGGFVSMLVFSALRDGLPFNHPFFWPGSAGIIGLTMIAGYVVPDTE